MEKSLLQVVPIDPMVKDVYRPKNVCQVGNYNMLRIYCYGYIYLTAFDQRFSYVFSKCRFFFQLFVANVQWIHRTSNLTLGQIFYGW